MSSVGVSAVYADKYAIESVDCVSGRNESWDQSYAYIVTEKDDSTSFTMRIAVHNGRFVWRDRDGAIDKQLELKRFELDETGAITEAVAISDIRLNDRVVVSYSRERDNVRISEGMGAIRQILVFA